LIDLLNLVQDGVMNDVESSGDADLMTGLEELWDDETFMPVV